jgi:hypothetical protein
MLLMVRATAFGLGGDVERGMAQIEQAQASLAPGDPFVAEVAVARGDLLVAAGEGLSEAEALFAEAASTQRGRGARMLELEALTRLARVQGAGPESALTRLRLREVCDAFTEGLGTVQLATARTVLDAG